jgi:hypothetical protein
MTKTGEKVMNLPPTPFMIGEVVVHKDGQRGTVCNSEFFDPHCSEYAQKVRVALIDVPENWAMDDLAEGQTVKIGQLIENRNGLLALALGIPEVGLVKVRKVRNFADWPVAAVVRAEDGATMVRQAAKIAVLEGELAAVKGKQADAPLRVPTEDEQPQVEVKTLVQRLTDKMDRPFLKQADEELAAALADGWAVLDISVNTVFDPGDKYLQSVRVVTLEKRNAVDELAQTDVPLHVPTKETAPGPELVMVGVEQPEEPVPSMRQPVAVTIDLEPVPVNNTISFEEALNNPRMSAADVAEVGNRIAFERGKSVFDGLQNDTYGNRFGLGVRRRTGAKA